MIINTKIEITLIIIFIIISIPLWIYFKQELNSQLALAIEGETKLDLFLNNIDGFDNVIVNNAYQVNKKYRILLVTDKNCDNSYITINKREYQLDNFEKRKVLNSQSNGHFLKRVSITMRIGVSITMRILANQLINNV